MTTPLLFTTVSNSTAKLNSYSVDPQLGGRVVELVRDWEHIDSRYSKALVDSMSTTGPVVNPWASASVYSGTWHRVKVVESKQGMMQDHITITETLVPTTIGSKSYDYAVNCREGRTVVLYSDLTTDQVDTVSGSYAASSRGHYYAINVTRNQRNGTWDVQVVDRAGVAYTDADFVSADSADSITETQRKYNQSTTSLSKTASTGVAVAANLTLNEFCLWDKDERSTTSKEHSTTEYTARDIVDAIDLRSNTFNAQALGVLGTTGAGITPTVTNSKNPDGTFNIDRTSRTAKEHTSAEYTAQSREDDITLRSQTFNAAAQGVLGTTGTGITPSVSNEKQPDGTYNIDRTSRTAKEHTSAEYTAQSRIDDITLRSQTFNAAAQGVLGATGTGITPTVSNEKQPDGTYNIDRSSRTAKEHTTAEYTAADRTNDITLRSQTFNAAAAGVLGTTGQGLTPSISNRKNPDGSYEIDRSSQTAKAHTIDEYTSRNTIDDITRRSRTINSTVAVSSPIATPAVTPTVTNEKNPDGTFNVDVTSRTSKEHSTSEYTSQDRTNDITRRSATFNAAALGVIDAASPGITPAISNDKQPDGTYNIDRRSTTAKEHTNDEYTATDRTNDITRTSQTFNAAAQGTIDTHTPGVTPTIVNRQNPDGSYEIEKRSTSAKEHSTTEYIARNMAGVIERRSQTFNATTAGVAPAASDGVTPMLTNSKNPDNTYDISQESSTAQPLSSTWSDGSYMHDYSSTELIAAASAPTVSSASVGVTQNISSLHARPDGYFDATIVGSTAVPRWSDAWDVIDSSATRSSTLFDNLSTIPTIDSSWHGGANPQRNEDGTYSGRVDRFIYANSWAWGGDPSSSAVSSCTLWRFSKVEAYPGVFTNKKIGIVYNEIVDYWDTHQDAWEATSPSDNLGSVSPYVEVKGPHFVSHQITVTDWGTEVDQ